MKILLALFLLFNLRISYAVECGDNSLFTAEYWGYWNVDLDKTNVPNVIWDTTDPYQIALAYTRGVTVFFNIQDLLFNWDPNTFSFSLRSDWQSRFNASFGNWLAPTNPYNISGLVAQRPGGFFLGNNLVWYNLSLDAIDAVCYFLDGVYPLAYSMIAEDYRIFKINTNYNGYTVFPNSGDKFSGELTLVMVTHVYPDIITDGVTSDKLVNLHKNYVHPRALYQLFIYTLPTYDTILNYTETSCHPASPDVTCPEVMLRWGQAFIEFVCKDFGCYDGPIEDCTLVDTCSFTVFGLVAWHWKSDYSLKGYEYGLQDIPELQAFQEYFGGSPTCYDIGDASHITAGILSLTFALLLLMI